jgi:hypothetical protein
MTTTDHPFLFVHSPELLGIVFQDVRESASLVGKNPGANIECDKELDLIISKAEAILPSAIGDNFRGHDLKNLG